MGFLRRGRTGSGVLRPSQRSVLNVNFVDFVYEYQFINHVMIGSPQLALIGASYNTPTYYHTLGNPTWSTDSSGANLDANGWPQNFAQVDGVQFGNHILVPAGTDYGQSGSGYTIEWEGDGRLTLTTGTWSNEVVVSGTNYTRHANGDWTGTNLKLTVNYTGSKQQIGWRVNRTGHLTNAYFRNLKIYRTADAADLAAGKVFRAGYKQLIVDQDPAAIRTMNWHGGNNHQVCRWEDRAKYPHAIYGGGYANVSLPYGETTGTAPDYVLAGVSGTPSSMVHGEIATARLHQTIPRTGNCTITAASPSTPGAGQTQFTVSHAKTGTTNGTTTISGLSSTSNLVVGMRVSGTDIPADTFLLNVSGSSATISNAATGSTVGLALTFGHPFSTGDVATFRNSQTSGWTALNFRDGTVTVVSDTAFYVTMDSTGFGTFVAATSSVGPQVTLQVGSGNDRTAYPVLDTQASTTIAMQGSGNFMHATDYRTFYFDKTVPGRKDSSGNLIAGAWLMQSETDSGQSLNGFAMIGTPIEIAAIFVKELNEMSPRRPIHLWLNIPTRALMSMDPDHSLASNYPYNAVVKALSILSLSDIHLFVEYSNETWNGPSIAFTQNQYLMQRVLYRTAGAQTSGITSYSYITSLRSVVMVKDITDNLGVHPRVHFVLAGQGAVGISGTVTSSLDNANTERALGNTRFHADSVVQSLPGIAKTGNVNSNTTLNGLASTADLRVGMGVSDGGVRITAGTQIASITNSTTVVLTIAASGTATGVSLTFQPTPISYHWGWASGAYFDPPTNHTATFTGAISGTTLTVSGFSGTALAVGDFVEGSGVSTNPNTKITAFGSGTGGNGTYTVSVSQAVGSTAMTKRQYMAYTTGTGTFTDDSAMFNGTNNTANGGGNYTGAANQAQAIANLTAQNSTGGDSQSVAMYQALATSYANFFSALDVYNTQYEGGYEMNAVLNSSYGGITITAAHQAFIIAWQNSQGWSDVIQAYLTAYRSNPMTVMPSPFYNMSGQVWGQTAINNSSPTPDLYLGGIEGAALNPTWFDVGTSNQLLDD